MDEKRTQISERVKKQHAAKREKLAAGRPEGWLVERLMTSPTACQMQGVVNHTGASHRGVVYPEQGLR